MPTTSLRLLAPVLAALLLAACASPHGGNSRAEHHYAFGQPAAPASGVAPVVTTTPQGVPGPQHLAQLVYFDYDSYSIRTQDRSLIEGHAQWLRQHPERSVLLRGHTDVRGGAEYNLALGQKRADAVRNALQLLGVAPARIEAVSYGKEQPADLGTSEDAHQRNRRVEFDYR
ncbi:peptidoglycan-associated lipoprotein Pal [Corticibacter populi]|uniref:Peptidoglycan-associated lipoprotein n=1 Tax=Corticibacter populi TaxID=1550736 RepID=A0A3M6QTF1_9BURK|nr:peptidoglycan-associated lipoprotein Pal [Corticibacter populi]RMX06305.1 peptidoglycan-associated lipoprotein Pal [Corticibacter populi]RZS32159.1 peptidoglycan-associated lipoprotein [Corticibacter populi]